MWAGAGTEHMSGTTRMLAPVHRVIAVASAAVAAAIAAVMLLVNAHEAQGAWPPLPPWVTGSLTLAAIAYVLEGGAAVALSLRGAPPISNLLARAAAGAGATIGILLFFSHEGAGFGRAAANGAIALAVGGALIAFDSESPRRGAAGAGARVRRALPPAPGARLPRVRPHAGGRWPARAR